VDLVLGVTMDPEEIRMVLVEGENAIGATVDEDDFHTNAPDPDNPTTSGPPAQVLSAILGTREGVAEGGYALTSTGVLCTDPTEANALRDALAAYKVENVMLVSAFVAAAALAQAAGQAAGCSRTAMLLVEPESATLGIVDSEGGSVTVVCTEPLDFSGRADQTAAGLEADTVAQLADMVTSCDTLPMRPEGVFVVGHGIDIAPLKPALDAVTPLTVSAPEEPETALARGAALASANAPLPVAPTAALAYSQDPGTDEVYRYLSVPDISEVGSEPLAYSSVPDPETDTDTVLMAAAVAAADEEGPDETPRRRTPLLLVSCILAAIIVAALAAMEVALAINIRTTVALQPSPQQNLIVPTTPAPAPAPKSPAAVPVAQLAPPSAPNRIKAPAIPAPAAPVPAAVPVPVPPAAPAPVPAAGLPAPVPVDPLPALFPPPVPGIQQAVLPPAAPVQLPNPALLIPLAPAQVPAASPPVQLPAPAVQLPAPPIQLPKPQLPALPAPPQLAPPPVQLSKPQLPAIPAPPVQLAPPPVQLPKPQLPALPAPPALLTPPQVQFPLPKAPAVPALPVPGLSVPGAPALPALPALPQNPFTPHSGS
jgi:hypothetical protein